VFGGAGRATVDDDIGAVPCGRGGFLGGALTVSVTSEQDMGAFYWAIVYVPQGTTPGNLTVNIGTGTTGMYEPNQFVMNCGVVDPAAGPIRFTSPVSRNLPPMIITLHLKFNCIKFVGPVDVRSLTHRQGG